MLIHAFDPFNLQHGSRENWHSKIQEVIYYGESHFWQAVSNIIKAQPWHLKWMQQVLQQELVH